MFMKPIASPLSVPGFPGPADHAADATHHLRGVRGYGTLRSNILPVGEGDPAAAARRTLGESRLYDPPPRSRSCDNRNRIRAARGWPAQSLAAEGRRWARRSTSPARGPGGIRPCVGSRHFDSKRLLFAAALQEAADGGLGRDPNCRLHRMEELAFAAAFAPPEVRREVEGTLGATLAGSDGSRAEIQPEPRQIPSSVCPQLALLLLHYPQPPEIQVRAVAQCSYRRGGEASLE